MGNKKDAGTGKRMGKGEKGTKVSEEAEGSPATVTLLVQPEGRESTKSSVLFYESIRTRLGKFRTTVSLPPSLGILLGISS